MYLQEGTTLHFSDTSACSFAGSSRLYTLGWKSAMRVQNGGLRLEKKVPSQETRPGGVKKTTLAFDT